MARIDDSRTIASPISLRLVVVAPKEKRNGTRIERVVDIKPHADASLCPVKTYHAYRTRIATTPCPTAHPVMDNVQINSLLRDIRHFTVSIGPQRIGKHINALTDLIQRPPGTCRPRTRALGSSRAAAAGAPVDHILTHGSWANAAVFDTFYRLARSADTNFTQLSLGN